MSDYVYVVVMPSSPELGMLDRNVQVFSNASASLSWVTERTDYATIYRREIRL